MPSPKAKRIVVALVVALVFYFGLIGYRAFDLVSQRALSLKVLGVAVLVLPLIGIWIVLVELRFGLATEIMGEQLDAEGVEPEPELPRTPSGRIRPDAADAHFALRQAELEAAPEDWRAWHRLSIAYDLAGDRKRAREAMRTAIGLCDLLHR
ncbi:MAG: hypothetical protein ABI232_12805 [Jatrophihabitantaceae bacterium]